MSMELESKEEMVSQKLRGEIEEDHALSIDGHVYYTGDELFPATSVVSDSALGTHTTTTKVVFLTVNDVYELLPDTNRVGGLAELATMLKVIERKIASDTHIIITLNGDFMWRSELDRKDKGALMVELLNLIGIEYVVVGNHEFDFGAEHLRDLLAGAKFTCFGSNVRSSSNKESFSSLKDTAIVPLRNELQLGMFGVVTTVIEKDLFAGPTVVFENEEQHARRCVESLRRQGADVIVALTHLKVAEDVRLAKQVPDIHLILGGHDHFPVTCAAGVHTLIHKSGMDALWLGVVEMTITTPITWSHDTKHDTNVRVEYQWQMLLNRGYHANPACLAIITKYMNDVEQEERTQGKLEVLAISRTALDGRRVTCRTQESNLCNLVTDALREGLGADVGLVNAGYIKGDLLNKPGLAITRKWLEKYLPLVKPTVVVELSLQDLKDALTYWLRRYPAMSSSHPHFSGLRVTYDVTEMGRSTIASIRLCREKYEETSSGIDEEQMETSMSRVITVGMPLVSSLDGWHFFARARQLRSGPLVRYLVEEFARQRSQVDYPAKEGRLLVTYHTSAL